MNEPTIKGPIITPEKLRALAKLYEDDSPASAEAMRDAADEIEAMRARMYRIATTK